MKSALLFLTTDFEETEAIVTTDILRRGGINIQTVSLTGELLVKGSHGICVKADINFSEISDPHSYNMIILPGGSGTPNYKKHEDFLNLVKSFAESDKYVGAICAAPEILGFLGLLEGKKAVCYPGCESGLVKAEIVDKQVVIDGKIITAKGPGVSIAFGLALLKQLTDGQKAVKIAEEFIYSM